MAEAASSQIFVTIDKLEFTVSNISSFSRGEQVDSPPVGPAGSFKCCLRVFPAGSRKSPSSSTVMAAFLAILPPKHLKDQWSCPDVTYSIGLRGKPDQCWEDTFTFNKNADDRGWHNIYYSSYTSCDGKVLLYAEVKNLPYVQPPPDIPFPDLDFSMEGKMLTFCLAEGPPLFFDQRLLMLRSEYFQTMLTSDEWQESRRGEVDFTGDPHVTKKILQAILHFILSDSFQVGSVEFNLEVRKLADRFCLKSLVEKVDAAMKDTLSEDNVLQILAEMHDTDSVLEKSCWMMLKSDCDILAQHEDLLDGLIAAKPDLARKLILLGRTKRARRS